MRIDENTIMRMKLDELVRARDLLAHLLAVTESRLAVPGEPIAASDRPLRRRDGRALAARVASAREALKPTTDHAASKRAQAVRDSMTVRR